MATGTPQPSVLLIGASQRVLDEAVAVLRDLGYTAQETNDFSSDITGRFDITNIDLIARRSTTSASPQGNNNSQAVAVPARPGVAVRKARTSRSRTR